MRRNGRDGGREWRVKKRPEGKKKREEAEGDGKGDR